MALKSELLNQIIDVEGGYVNDPSDSGGETNFGITEAVARAAGYQGSMRDLPRQLAFDIYAKKYWDSVHGDTLAQLSEHVTREVVDTGVNMGIATAVTFLQRALNVLNDRERLYPDLVVDGHIGPATLRALSEYLAVRSELVLLRALNCLQCARYIGLAERREKDERFVYGWLNHRVVI